MRVAIYVAVLVACIAAAPELTRAALACAAAVLFETLPYAAAAAMLAPILGRFAPGVVGYAGCGCGAGPGARSIPATVACAAVFGPYVAFTRWIAAIAVSFAGRGRAHAGHGRAPVLDDLAQLAPAALFSGVLTIATPALDIARWEPAFQILSGVVIGFAASPCALGGIAVASVLRAQSPLAAASMLCVAGIVDLRVWWKPHHIQLQRDRATYALLATACAVVAYEHGAMLVHPRMIVPLWACAVFCAYLALRSPNGAAASFRLAGALLLMVSLTGSPPPAASATEGAIDTLYPGENISFTGRYLADDNRPRLVRYAITCCRADARPVAIQLSQRARANSGDWLCVHGVVTRRGDALVVDAGGITVVAPPADPFVYL